MSNPSQLPKLIVNSALLRLTHAVLSANKRRVKLTSVDLMDGQIDQNLLSFATFIYLYIIYWSLIINISRYKMTDRKGQTESRK